MYDTAQMQVDDCNQSTCEYKLTLLSKLAKILEHLKNACVSFNPKKPQLIYLNSLHVLLCCAYVMRLHSLHKCWSLNI